MDLKNCITMLLDINMHTEFVDLEFKDHVQMGLPLNTKIINCNGHHVAIEKEIRGPSLFIQASVMGGVDDNIGLLPKAELADGGEKIKYNNKIKAGWYKGVSVASAAMHDKTLIVISSAEWV